MAAEIICDGCGKRVPMEHRGDDYVKPHLWYQRSDKDGIQVACSRECIRKISEKTGKTSICLPW